MGSYPEFLENDAISNLEFNEKQIEEIKYKDDGKKMADEILQE